MNWDQPEYNNMHNYLTKGVKPKYLPARLDRFVARAKVLSIDKNGNIVHENKLLVPENRTDEVLTNLYRDPVTSINSRDRFYEVVTDRYVGISRRRVQDFLLQQEAYQIHLPSIKHKIVHPIVTHRNLQHYQVDLIDMSGANLPWWNNGVTRILTMVDLFSKYAFAFALKDGTAASVIKALRDHFTNNPKPKIIQSDNGPEFGVNTFTTFLTGIGIKHVRSQPYKPTSQGGVERFNRTIKQRLFHYMSIYNTKTYVDLIPKVLEGYNNATHSTTRKRPVEVYNTSNNEVISVVGRNIQSQADKIRTPVLEPLEKGQSVRISNYTNPDMKHRKDKFAKKYKANWSRAIFTVVSGSGNGRYKLKDVNGLVLPIVFQRYELLPINKETLVVVAQRRPQRFDEHPLMEEVIEQRAQDRREGIFIVPMKVPEYTQAQERTERRKTAGVTNRGNLPANVQRLIGKRIMVYWPSLKKWFNGTIIEYAVGKQEFILRYDKPDKRGETDFYERLQGYGKSKWKFLEDESESESDSDE